MGKLSGDENSPEESKQGLAIINKHKHIHYFERESGLMISGLPLLASLTIHQNQAFH